MPSATAWVVEGGDDVVGLVAVELEVGDVQGVEHPLDQRQLAAELVGRLVALRLVLGVLLEAEGLARLVEGDRDVRGHLVAQHVDEHRGEAVDGVGVLPGGGREVLHRQREERAVGQRVAVEEQEPGAGGGVGGRRVYRGDTAATLCRRHRRVATVGNNGAHERPNPATPPVRRRLPGPHARGHGRPQREDGHRARRDLRRAGRGDDAVEGNTQPYGLLHGGASVVLAESLGSVGSAMHAAPDRLAVGVDISATHHRSATSGTVTGVATAVHLGPHSASVGGRDLRRAGQAGVHLADHLHAAAPRALQA